MPQWTAFAVISGVVLLLLLVLSHLTQQTFDTDADADNTGSDSEHAEPFDGTPFESATAESDARSPAETASSPETVPDLGFDSSERRADVPGEPDTGTETIDRTDADTIDPSEVSTAMLLANVAASQGLFALVLIGAALYTGVPASALGLEFSWAALEAGLVLGTAAGLVLYVANEIGASLATRFGFDHDEQLREMLAPDSGRGWALLLGGVLPIIAIFEELLFRAALIGVLWAGFGIDPWLLAVASSIAFALGHGMQGSVGVVVTGLLGFVLAAIFVVTGSLLVVIVAHYWINALEFVVHEGLDLEWAKSLEG
ncbi:CPBP family intramembrane glutamic endopeptidase [Natrarchaeobaculum aegyptiacum]|uniref:Abortive phage infection protein n=1 Tax=Natrarchaeobaculum aegyptiacum TaxID=745377 RepID=A0A2Z2HT02_9EURY|nr:CPBP family intramembrane glutamic endopeptidase [Natrarchaeobaculum aegyptiacum]ARS90309.1 abortive phage infection protein [Natrarchaeobaculum aegyptiacum]